MTTNGMNEGQTKGEQCCRLRRNLDTDLSNAQSSLLLMVQLEDPRVHLSCIKIVTTATPPILCQSTFLPRDNISLGRGPKGH